MSRSTTKAIRKRPPKESGFLPWKHLRTAEERLMAVAKKLPMILFALDQEGNVTLLEGRGLKGFGFKPGQLVGTSIFDLYRARPDILQTVRRALDGKTFVEVTEIDGVVLETQFTPLFDKEGNFVGTIGISLDISDRRQAEEKLKHTTSEMEAIFQALPDVYFRLNEHGVIQDYKAESVDDLPMLPEKFSGKKIQEVFPEKVGVRLEHAIHKAQESKSVVAIEYGLGFGGEERFFEARLTPMARKQSVLIIRNVSSRKRAEVFMEGQKRLLEEIAKGTPLPQVLDKLCKYVEDQANGVLICSVLLLDDGANRLRHGGAPSLPREYNEAVDGILIGPNAGSCGTAAFHGRTVVVTDISRDPLWKDYRAAGLKHGLQACWSTPIISSTGKVLGTFAIYYREQRGPTSKEKELTEIATHLAKIAIERERSQQELAKSETRLREIVENSSNLFYSHTPDHILTYVSPQARQFLDCEPEEALVRWPELVTDHPINQEAMKHTENAIRTGKRQPVYQIELLTRKGRKVWAEVNEAPVVRDGKTVAIVGALIDITERKRAAEALEAQRVFFRQVIDMNPNFVFAKDRQGRFTLINEAVAEAYGVPVDGLLGKTDADVNPNAAEVAHFRQDDLEVINTGNEKFIAEEVITDASGKQRWLQTIKRPLTDADNTINQVLGVATDITERKRMEEALRLSEERYRQMFENNPLPMFVYDVETLDFLAVNNAAVVHYGYTREEFLSLTIKEIRPIEDVPMIIKVIQDNPDRPRIAGPLRHKKKDGSIIQVEVNSHGINFGGRKSRVVLVNDVTERKKSEQAVLHSQKLESVGILAGGIAHDFNNLLMGVLGNSDLALQKMEAGSKIEVHIQQIKNASLKAAELCRQLLAYSGKGRFDVSFLDLNGMIKELTTLLELSIHKGIRLNLNLDPRLPSVHGDKVQIQQVIMNLVINSSEAIGDQEGQITVTTKKIRADRGYLQWAHLSQDLREGDYVLFEVRDTGCGMDPETVQRIFDPFFTTKFTGRGLGLAAVLGIVTGHGGAIRVESERGLGTAFKILLPTQEESPAEEEDLPRAPGQEWQGSGTILVVDDEEAVRAVSELMLPTLGFEVLTAPDGFKACELLRDNRDRVVVVLLDLTMPRMDGARALHELRKIKPGVKVLLMSGYDEKEAVNRFTNEGFDSFLQKPFVRRQLQDKLEAMLPKS